MTVNFTFATTGRGAIPDPASRPDLFDAILTRRVLAYGLDVLCIGTIAVVTWVAFVILTVLSLGLLAPVLWLLFGLIPLAYHTLLLSGPRAATFGMRACDLQLRSWDGERPVFLQALAHTALFYVSVGATCFLILLLPLFNLRRRTLHDILAGVLMVRTPRDLC